jgi:hypothetical protein
MTYDREPLIRYTLRWKEKRAQDGTLSPSDPGLRWLSFVGDELAAGRMVTAPKTGGCAPGLLVAYVLPEADERARAFLDTLGAEGR